MEAYYLEITRIGFYLYILLLVVAAAFDAWKFIIPNVLSVALIGLFLVVATATPFPVNWWSHVGAAVVFFAGGLVLYRFRILGAGDIKLITSVALWAGFEHLPVLILGVALAGGALSLFLIILRRVIVSVLVQLKSSKNPTLPRILLVGEAVPYGVGIAAGAIWLSSSLPLLGGL
jgi:prepilin peptidase CpaA